MRSLGEEAAPESSVNLAIQFQRGVRETSWRFEQGAWKLEAFDKVAAPPRPPASAAKPKR